MSEEKKPQEKAAAEPEKAAEEAKTDEAGKAKPEAEKKSSNGGGLGGGLAGIALIASLAVAAGGAYLWKDLKRGQEVLADANSQLQQSLQALRSAEQSRQSALNQRIQQQQQAITAQREALQRELQTALASLHKELGRDRDGWVRYEVEYLLAYANRRLQLDGDVRSADAALLAADERLKAQGNPALLPVREAIAGERRALAAVPQPDIEGMVLELAAQAEGVASLPLPGAPQRAPEQPEATAAPAEPGLEWSDWRQLGSALWADLRSLVTVRTGRDRPLPLTSPEQRFFLQENLRLKLLSARMALLQDETASFRTLLTEADGWLAQYFDSDSTAVRATRESLQRLAQVEPSPVMPDISGSLHRLRKLEAPEPPAAEATEEENSEATDADQGTAS